MAACNCERRRRRRRDRARPSATSPSAWPVSRARWPARGLDEVLVGEVQAGWRHAAGHHPLRPPEEVLVVGVPGGAVGENQRRLAASSGAPAPLGVVRGRGRDVAHVHRVQLGDVDARVPWSANRTAPAVRLPGSASRAASRSLGRHLGRVLPRREALQFRSHRLVEPDEERVDPAARLRWTRPPHADRGAPSCRRPATQRMAAACNWYPGTSSVASRLRDDLHLARRLAEPPADLADDRCRHLGDVELTPRSGKVVGRRRNCPNAPLRRQET